MDWDDMESILFDGSQEEINNLVCSECGGTIEYEFWPSTDGMLVMCIDCGNMSIMHGVHYTPACTKYFGNKHRIGPQSKN